MRVVRGESAAGLAEKERIHAADRHDRDEIVGRNVRIAADTRGCRLAQINAQAATPASASAASWIGASDCMYAIGRPKYGRNCVR